MRLKVRIVSTVLLVLLLATTAPAQERVKLKVAALTLPVFNPIIVNLMKEKGFDARHGLTLGPISSSSPPTRRSRACPI